MTSYTWNAGTGNWDVASHWNPSGTPGGVPANADAASLIATSGTGAYTVTVLTGESYSLSQLTMNGQSAFFQAALDIFGTVTTDTLAFTSTSGGLGGDSSIKVDLGGVLDIQSALTAPTTRETIYVNGAGTNGGDLILGSSSVYTANVTFAFLNNSLGSTTPNTGLIEYQGAVPTTTSQIIKGWAYGDAVKFDNANFAGDTVTYSSISHTITVMNGASTVLTMSNITAQLGTTFAIVNGDEIVAVCFGAGTRIRTPDGDVAIESLRPGDAVITPVADGAPAMPVKWIGRRRIDLTAHPRPERVAPIRIKQHAFAENVPARDLIVSPDHAIFVDGKLISARQLVNGTTIAQAEGRTSVEYFHVELDRHAIILAEGLSAESYLDTGNRSFFANGGVPQVLHPDLHDDSGQQMRQAASCAEFVWQDEDVRPVWQQLAARAAELGAPVALIDTTLDPEVALVVGGKTLRPVSINGNRYQFVLPARTTRARLTSRAATANGARPWVEDRRSLGVYVQSIRLRQSGEVVDLPLDHPTLSDGWWAVEHDGVEQRRWTSGDAALTLPATSAPAILEIVAGNAGLAYLVAEPQAQAA